MPLMISRALQARLRALAAADPAREVCGLLLGEGERVTEVRATANVAPQPARRFEIDPGALFAAIRSERSGGPAIVGYYHSHPGGNARPSETDAAMASNDGKSWLIIAGEMVAAWQMTSSGFSAVEITTD